jgi:hypothetical protein
MARMPELAREAIATKPDVLALELYGKHNQGPQTHAATTHGPPLWQNTIEYKWLGAGKFSMDACA